MNEQKLRGLFEEWANKNNFSTARYVAGDFEPTTYAGKYQNDFVQVAWESASFVRQHDGHADQQERLDTAESALLAHGYRKSCSIPACNCGDKWHHGGHAMERLSGIEATTADYYRNGELLLTRIERIVAIADSNTEFVRAVRSRAMQISFADAIVEMCGAELAKEQNNG